MITVCLLAPSKQRFFSTSNVSSRVGLSLSDYIKIHKIWFGYARKRIRDFPYDKGLCAFIDLLVLLPSREMIISAHEKENRFLSMIDLCAMT